MGTEPSTRNIAFVGHYNEHSGSGRMARSYLKALVSAGFNITARPLNLSGVNSTDEEIIALEQNRFDKYDAVIQCVLPHFMEKIGGVPNIGIALYEGFSNESTWKDNINLLDRLIVPTEYTNDCFYTMGVNIPTSVVGIPSDKVYRPLTEKLEHPDIDGCYVFYTIADLVKRKNLSSIVKAYLTGFRREDPVCLVLKISKHGATPQQIYESVNQDCQDIIESTKLFPVEELCPNIVILAGDFSEEDMEKVHATGDCFIMSSYGESWSYPLYDALHYGKQTIVSVPGNGDVKEIGYMYPYLDSSMTAESYPSVLLGENGSFPFLYKGNEVFLETNIIALRQEMRIAYNRRNNNPSYKSVTTESVGIELKGIIEHEIKRDIKGG